MFDVDLDKVPHHPSLEELVQVLCNKLQVNDRGFFQVVVAFNLAMVAANMRVSLHTKDRGIIPVNLYALALATSGYGKGFSTTLLEEAVFHKYRERFLGETFPQISDQYYLKIAQERAIRNSSDLEGEYDKVVAASNRAGSYLYSFDSGTVPAVKQQREKLLMTSIGGLNLIVDEIGSNLVNSLDMLAAGLELYDKGRLKAKLVKNTAENIRNEDASGCTPMNMLLFGTPSRLLNNSSTEDDFYSMLDTGYARRCFFGYGKAMPPETVPDAETLYDQLSSTENNIVLDKWADKFYELADPEHHNKIIEVNREVGILLIKYKQFCEAKAWLLPEHEEIQKNELSHRYFKALKLAGAYAFVDGTSEVTVSQLLAAIKFAEESGASFQTILNRDKPYVKLAKFIVDSKAEVTHVDMIEKLPFYKVGQSARNDLMNMAVAWGYPRHIIIKKTFVDGIEFYRGETLKETDIENVKISYSTHYAEDYGTEEVPFSHLHTLTQAQGHHWCSHGFLDAYRDKAHVVAGFNLLVLDVDEGATIASVRKLLEGYKYHIYTTKRHQTEGHGDRFRVILPMNYTLELDDKDYKLFFESVYSWLPFPVDTSTSQRERKWASHVGEHYTNMEGELFDCLPHIPRTRRNDEYQNQTKTLGNLNNLERWFAQRMVEGARNNHMIKFAYTLMDSGFSYQQVKDAVLSFNAKLNDPLTVDELDQTIFLSIAGKFHKDGVTRSE